jgi:hypothetical protein
MNFIKKIFDRNIDESVHLQFQKFSKGEFKDRAMINARQSKGKYIVNTTAEFANDLVREVAKKLGNKETIVKGAIVSTSDLSRELDFQDKKQFQGVKRYIIDKEMSGDNIINLIEKFPKAFFALSFSVENTILKIKPKAPKSGKPGSKGDKKPNPNFCKVITTDKKLGGSFVLEKQDFKKAEITHNFIIDQLILPEAEKDYTKIRELAKRKGKIIREANIDDKEIVKEIEFVA